MLKAGISNHQRGTARSQNITLNLKTGVKC